MYALYIAPMGAGSDMSQVCAGLVAALNQAGLKTVVFKPIGADVSVTDASQLWAKGSNDQLMEDIIGAYYTQAADAQVVVVEGLVNDTQQYASLAPYAAQINAELIRNLQADVVLVAAQADQVQTLCVDLASTSYHLSSTQVVGVTDQHSDPVATLNIGDIKARALTEREAKFSPPAFRHQLIESARKANKRIVLPEGDEPRTIKAAIICTEKQIARCVLMAKLEDVERVASEQGLTLPDSLEIMDPALTRANYVAPLVEMRKAKGMTEEQAAKELEDTVMQGTVMMAWFPARCTPRPTPCAQRCKSSKPRRVRISFPASFSCSCLIKCWFTAIAPSTPIHPRNNWPILPSNPQTQPKPLAFHRAWR